MTRWAGKFTPQASVAVATKICGSGFIDIPIPALGKGYCETSLNLLVYKELFHSFSVLLPKTSVVETYSKSQAEAQVAVTDSLKDTVQLHKCNNRFRNNGSDKSQRVRKRKREFVCERQNNKKRGTCINKEREGGREGGREREKKRVSE